MVRGNRLVKILARNHQYLGVNEAVKAYEARRLNNGKLGVFLCNMVAGQQRRASKANPGGGRQKAAMVFLAQKIRRKFSGSPTIVVLTDREELTRLAGNRTPICSRRRCVL